MLLLVLLLLSEGVTGVVGVTGVDGVVLSAITGALVASKFEALYASYAFLVAWNLSSEALAAALASSRAFRVAGV